MSRPAASPVAGWAAAGRDHDRAGLEEELLAGPLRAITPWEWDWFRAV